MKIPYLQSQMHPARSIRCFALKLCKTNWRVEVNQDTGFFNRSDHRIINSCGPEPLLLCSLSKRALHPTPKFCRFYLTRICHRKQIFPPRPKHIFGRQSGLLKIQNTNVIKQRSAMLNYLSYCQRIMQMMTPTSPSTICAAVIHR